MPVSTCNKLRTLWQQLSSLNLGMRYGRTISTILSVTEIVKDSLRSFEVSHGGSLPPALSALENREGEPEGGLDEAMHWNASLLPRSTAPHVLRVAILHPGILENFLLRFFVQASDFWAQKSTYRRAILILQAVPRFGWSADKHTKMLMELGALDPSGGGSDTVKKFIRDLRRRYQKYLAEKAQRAT